MQRRETAAAALRAPQEPNAMFPGFKDLEGDDED